MSQFKQTILAILLAICMLSSFVGYSLAQSSVFAPIWMKKGAYVEFSFEEGLKASSSNASAYVTYTNGTLRWECIDLTGDLAKLKLTLKYNETAGVTTISGELFVDAVNRSCYNLERTLLGTTRLWLDPNPLDGEEIVLWDLPPEKIFGLIEGGRVGDTPQGRQESYKVSGNGTIGGNSAVFDARYDKNTGLMIRGLPWNEPALIAIKTGLLNNIMISDTNIDLGPPTETAEFNAFIPIIIVIVAFIGIFTAVYWARSKKRKALHKH